MARDGRDKRGLKTKVFPFPASQIAPDPLSFYLSFEGEVAHPFSLLLSPRANGRKKGPVPRKKEGEGRWEREVTLS